MKKEVSCFPYSYVGRNNGSVFLFSGDMNLQYVCFAYNVFCSILSTH